MGTPAVIVTAMIIGVFLIEGVLAACIERCRAKRQGGDR